MLTVREIWRYPVKSLGGEQLVSARIGELGITGDRAWGVRDEMTGMILTGRREPRLLMAVARLEDGEPVIEVDRGRQLTCSGELSAWLDRPVELVAAGAAPATFEGVDNETESEWATWQGPARSFHDGASAVTLVSNTSLGDHERRRFRINLVLEHDGDGVSEDDLVGRQIAVGGVGLYVRKPVARCVMVTRPQPGIEADRNVLKRVIRERGNLMGVGARVEREGLVEVGDMVEVL